MASVASPSPQVVFRCRSLSSSCTRTKNYESNLSLSKEILKFLGPSFIKFATFIVPNVIVCCLLRARGEIEDRIVGPRLLLCFPLLRQFSICAFLHGFQIGVLTVSKRELRNRWQYLFSSSSFPLIRFCSYPLDPLLFVVDLLFHFGFI